MNRRAFRDGELMRRVDPYLAGILVIAAVARYWGIGFGLPYIDARPDEPAVATIAVGFFSGDPNPHFFNYPTLYMYCLFFLYLCYALLSALAGKPVSLANLPAQYYLHPANFVLIDRCFSALLGTATVLVVYKLTKTLFDRRTALLAAFLLALGHLHVRDSHFGVTDVAATFLITCSTYFIYRSYVDKSARSYLYAGILTGLAASTKYAGAFLIVPMLAVHVLNVLELSPRRWRLLFDKRIALFLETLPLAFLLGTPFALLDSGKFVTDLRFEMAHLMQGHAVLLGHGWWYHLRYSLLLGLGWTLWLASLAGIPWLMKKDWRKGAILCLFPLIYYIVTGRGYTVFLRYAIPLVPFLAITGAITVAALGDTLGRRFGLRRDLVTPVLAMLVILPSAYSVLRSDALLAKRDNRLIAMEWMRKHIPAGSSIFMTATWRDMPVPALDLLALARPYTPYPQAAIRQMGPFRALPRWDEWTDPARPVAPAGGGEPTEIYPQHIITRESPLVALDENPEPLVPLLEVAYRLERSFVAIDLQQDNWFDQQDAFYVPFTGFRGVRRPGPNIYIYERVGGTVE